MKTLRRDIFLIVPFLLLAPAIALAANPKTSKRPISEQEFLRLVQTNSEIDDRIVPASALINAIRWAQGAAMRHEKLPEFGIQMDDCIVKGDLSFIESDYDDEGNRRLGKGLLLETPVGTLPHDLSEKYQSLGIKNVFVIPIVISFLRVQLEGDFDTLFVNTIFEANVDFNSAVFDGSVIFDHSIFRQPTDFTAANFKAEGSFEGTMFDQWVNFAGVTFKDGGLFDRAIFQGAVDWSGAEFGDVVSFHGTSFNDNSKFYRSVFPRRVDFAEARITGSLQFSFCKFEADVFFIGLNKPDSLDDKNDEGSAMKGSLKFDNTIFLERAYFTDARLAELSFFPVSIKEQLTKEFRQTREADSPVTMSKRAVFTGLQCDRADFREIEFRDYADISGARFKQYVDFRNATFEGGVNFYQTEFPAVDSSLRNPHGTTDTGVLLDGVQLPRGFSLEWKQIDRKVNATDPNAFKRIEDAFQQAGDLEGHNGAMYHRRYLEGDRAGRWQWLGNRIDFIFWGYGVRPLRVFGWIVIVFLLFTAIYWTQTEALGTGKHKLRDAWTRLKFAVPFSLRTSWTLGFGYKNARTIAFKILTVVHSIGFKVLLIFLVQSFANTSPLLNELVGKLVRI